MTTGKQTQDQIDQLYAAFTALLPDLMKTSAGKWALLRNERVEAIFDTGRDWPERSSSPTGFALSRESETAPWISGGSLMPCLSGQYDPEGRFSFSI